METGRDAGQARKGGARRQSAKPPGGRSAAGGKPVRLQIYLSEETAKRLGVHCALSGLDRSAVLEKLLGSHLRERGRGRELWEKVIGSVDLANEGIGGTDAL